MQTFSEIAASAAGSPFSLIGKDWMLITAEKDGKANTMTAAWGSMGIFWGKEVVFIGIRPQRFTKEFVDAAETFSLTFFDGGARDILNYMGSTSGRDEDKIAKAGLTLLHDGATPYFAEGKLIFVCKKLYAQALDPKCFLQQEPDSKWYPEKDYHTVYVAEVIKVLKKEGE